MERTADCDISSAVGGKISRHAENALCYAAPERSFDVSVRTFYKDIAPSGAKRTLTFYFPLLFGTSRPRITCSTTRWYLGGAITCKWLVLRSRT